MTTISFPSVTNVIVFLVLLILLFATIGAAYLPLGRCTCPRRS